MLEVLIRDQKVRPAAAPEGDELTAVNFFGAALVGASMLGLVYGGSGVPVWAPVGAMVVGGLLLLLPKNGWTSAVALREAPPGIFLHSRRDSALREVA